MLKITTLVLTLGMIFSAPLSAEDTAYKCPLKVSYVTNNAISEMVLPIMKDVYQKLGCSTNFIAEPSKRSIASFNSGESDGELLRQPLVEDHYHIDFIRSQAPYLVLKHGIWASTEESDKFRPIAFQYGVVWQDNAMKDRDGQKFYREGDMVDAFNAGKVRGFLSNQITIKKKISNREINRPISLNEEIVKSDVHHYLKRSYAPFMAAFDAYVEENKPFDVLQ